MDKLDKIYDMQESLDDYISQRYGLVYPQFLEEEDDDYEENLDMWLQQMCLCLYSEVNELQNETHWKHWKVYPEPINKEKAKQEAIDILFFTISVCQKLGMTADDIYEEFESKFRENTARQNGTVKGREEYGM